MIEKENELYKEMKKQILKEEEDKEVCMQSKKREREREETRVLTTLEAVKMLFGIIILCRRKNLILILHSFSIFIHEFILFLYIWL